MTLDQIRSDCIRSAAGTERLFFAFAGCQILAGALWLDCAEAHGAFPATHKIKLRTLNTEPATALRYEALHHCYDKHIPHKHIPLVSI